MTITLEKNKIEVFVLPLRGIVIFPGSIIPLFVGRQKSINSLNKAMQNNKRIFLITQKNININVPKIEDLYSVGTLVNILQLIKLPDGTVKALIEGVQRLKLESIIDDESLFVGNVSPLLDQKDEKTHEINLLTKSIHERFNVYSKMNNKLPSDIKKNILKTFEANKIVDLITANIELDIPKKQQLLSIVSEAKRLEKLLVFIETNIDILESEQRINDRVKKQINKTQREYYLHEKMKAIHHELGDDKEALTEFAQLKKGIEDAGMPNKIKDKALSELKKLNIMSTQSPESSVIRNYLDWLVSVPWKKSSRLSKDLNKAETILNEEHSGLNDVKERILEYLAVQQRVKKSKSPIICLVGPPGVGKTTLARSIAKATNRSYVRVSLGGIRDEAEIRGHRRTYIGAMPGKIIQKIKTSGKINPLFLLDEIDKISSDVRGDPSSALLEVLDPEQNKTFNDHYLDVDYDLSNVMFIATANSMNIPEALLDRMEIIQLSGYTENEKLEIAENHLLKRQLKDHGLSNTELKIDNNILLTIIQLYTRESGVRLLEREISKICRKAVKKIITNKKKNLIKINAKSLEKYLGTAKYRIGLAEENNKIGQVSGLAWTSVGGDLLSIESSIMPGKGKIITTGQLGSVMQESTQTAMSVIRSRCEELGLDKRIHEQYDLHLHFPEGATKKDGPSAGIAICTAIISAFTKIEVKSNVAMTGEITLRGEVLPIGGLKEKLLAAIRAGIKKVIIPHKNTRDLKEIPNNILNKIDIQPVKWIEDVFEISLVKPLNYTLNTTDNIVSSVAKKNNSNIANSTNRH